MKKGSPEENEEYEKTQFKKESTSQTQNIKSPSQVCINFFYVLIINF